MATCTVAKSYTQKSHKDGDPRALRNGTKKKKKEREEEMRLPTGMPHLVLLYLMSLLLTWVHLACLKLTVHQSLTVYMTTTNTFLMKSIQLRASHEPSSLVCQFLWLGQFIKTSTMKSLPMVSVSKGFNLFCKSGKACTGTRNIDKNCYQDQNVPVIIRD